MCVLYAVVAAKFKPILLAYSASFSCSEQWNVLAEKLLWRFVAVEDIGISSLQHVVD